jgi:hypothetical protein
VFAGTGTCATWPAGTPSSTHHCSVSFSCDDSRGSSCQPNRGLQSASSRAPNGGIAPWPIWSSIILAFADASSYVVSENGAMPPSW